MEVTIVRSQVQRCMHVNILAIKDLLKQQLHLVVELLNNSVVVLDTQQVFEFSQNVFVLARVELSFVAALEFLDLKEELCKLLEIWNFIDFNSQDCFNGLVALGELAHGTIVNWIPPPLVLCCEDLSISVDDVF